MSEAKKNNHRPNKRHNARCAALQALYQWDHTHEPADAIYQHFVLEHELKDTDLNYFSTLLQGTTQSIDEIDELIVPRLDRNMSELNPVELAVLRLATFELKERVDVPYRVVINEALELAKKFGAVEGYKYVNGVLDKLARDLRPIECN